MISKSVFRQRFHSKKKKKKKNKYSLEEKGVFRNCWFICAKGIALPAIVPKFHQRSACKAAFWPEISGIAITFAHVSNIRQSVQQLNVRAIRLVSWAGLPLTSCTPSESSSGCSNENRINQRLKSGVREMVRLCDRFTNERKFSPGWVEPGKKWSVPHKAVSVYLMAASFAWFSARGRNAANRSPLG